VDESGGVFDGQDTGGGGGAYNDDDDDDDVGGVDFGLSIADDASQSQLVTSQALDDGSASNGSLLLAGDNLLAVPRKVCFLFRVSVSH